MSVKCGSRTAAAAAVVAALESVSLPPLPPPQTHSTTPVPAARDQAALGGGAVVNAPGVGVNAMDSSVGAPTVVPRANVNMHDGVASTGKMGGGDAKTCVTVDGCINDDGSGGLYHNSVNNIGWRVPEERRLRPPDGGWGWAIVAAAFFINMASDGISLSFGLLYIEFLNYFGQSRSTTSWVGSLFMAVPMLTGPLASAMVDRFGCRAMTILGGVVSGMGFVVSASAETIGQMYLTFGVLAGLGLGLCFITAVVSIAYWFERRRTLAMSLGAAGTGFGTFIYAPATNYFISEFGWRGTVLLLAGTFFNLCVCGVVMRDPAWWTAEQARVRQAANERVRQEQVTPPEFVPLRTSPVGVAAAPPGSPSTHSASAPGTPLTDGSAGTPLLPQRPRVLAPSTPVSSPDFVPLRTSPVVPTAPAGSLSTYSASAPGTPLTDGSAGTPLLPQRPWVPAPQTPVAPPAVVLLRAESVPCFRRRVSLLGPPSSLPTVPAPAVVMNDTSYRSPKGRGIVALLRAVVDFSLFLELHFLLMSVSTALLYTWFFVPYFYLADYLKQSGLHRAVDEPDEAPASQLLSVVGITNTIGMVALGYVGDHPRVHATKTYALCLLVCGLAIALMPLLLLRGWLLAVACAAFGASFASTFSFTPTILAELVPMERFTVAYGLNLLCQGVGNLLGPPFAGWLYDVTQSWDLTFYMAGLNICIAAGLTALIPYTKNRRLL